MRVRKRDVIEGEYTAATSCEATDRPSLMIMAELEMEVLLDIRDLLRSIKVG